MGELVLVAGRDVFRTAGGGESYVIAQGCAATMCGYSPQVFTLMPRRETIRTDFGVIHRVATPITRVRMTTAVLQRPWLAPAIVEFLRDRPGPHVIHSFGSWADSGVAASRALARHGVEAIPIATCWSISEHEVVAKLRNEVISGSRLLWAGHRLELLFAREVTARVERHAYRACRTVLVNYDSAFGLLEDRCGPGMDIRKLGYAAATAFEPDGGDYPIPGPIAEMVNTNAPLIVSVSRHAGRKGLDLLIHALALLRDSGVPYRACLVGTGTLLERHRRLVKSLDLSDRVALPGRVPDVRPYLHHADVFVLPSTEEGSGSVAVLEALQAGVAVVSSAVDGMPEDLSDDRTAILVEPGNVADLHRGIDRLLQDAALRERLAGAGRHLYEESFSPKRASEDLKGVYAELGLLPAT